MNRPTANRWLQIPHAARQQAATRAQVPLRLQAMHREVLERLWQGLVILAVVGAPVSALRALETGWQDLYALHLVLGAFTVAIYASRRLLSLKLLAGLAFALLWTVGLLGLFTMGLLGAGIWWLVMSSLVASTLYSRRAGILTISAVFLALALAGIGFVSGRLTLPVDANVYAHSPTAWVTLFLATALLPVIVFQAVASLQRMMRRLLEEVESQRIQIEHLATHDRLTGLPQMSLAMDRLEQALISMPRARRKVGVLFLDLDGFKAANDRHGHATGDQVLIEVGRRLRAAVRRDDTAARIGGDEFIVVLEGLLEPEDALSVADKIIAAMAEPCSVDGESIPIGVSVGCALAPDHGMDPPALLQAADAAMYRAKALRHNCAELANRNPAPR